MRRRHSLLLRLHFGALRRRAVVVLAAASLATAACGANVPTKSETVAALSKAIASPLTRTLPLSTYCMTVHPDYSLANMGQIDLVEMFQNLKDKAPLDDATTAGVVRVELKEFRVNPGGRSPDPSCDALHEQYKEARVPVRFAVVHTTLTPKGTAGGVEFDHPIEVATRELADVTEIRAEPGGTVAANFTWKWTPTKMAETIGYTPPDARATTARLRHANSGWVVEDTGIKR